MLQRLRLSFLGYGIPGFPDTRLPVTSKRSGKMLAAGKPGSAWELDGLEVNVDIVNLVEEEILLTAVWGISLSSSPGAWDLELWPSLVGKRRRNSPVNLAPTNTSTVHLETPGEELRKWGGAKAILAIAANSKSQGPLMGGLATRGKLIVVGVGSEPIEINPLQLIVGSRTIQGEVVGTSIDEEDTLDFSALQAVRPMIERVPLEQVPEAYAKMMRNEARFRMVIDFSL